MYTNVDTRVGNGKDPESKDQVDAIKLTIIGNVKTKLSKDVKSNVPRGRTITRKERAGRGGSGLALLESETIKFQEEIANSAHCS